MTEQQRKPSVHLATGTGLQVSDTAKIELIRKYQRLEGNLDCCASAYNRVCKQSDCLWRNECLTTLQE